MEDFQDKLNNSKKNINGVVNSDDADEVRVFFESIIALMPGHVYWKNSDGVLLGCNDLQAKSAGLASRKDIVGKTDYELPWKNQADALREVDKKVMERGVPLTIEEFSTLSDGTEAVFLSKKVPLYHKNKIIGILGISFDITEQKRNEEELRETKYMLENVINTIPGHVYWKDRSCIYVGCNDTQAYSLGLASRQEIVGKTDFDLPWKEQAPKLREIDLRVINYGASITAEEPALLADGRIAIFLSKKEPLRDKNNNIVGVLGVSIDITDKRKVEQELQEAQSKLENVIDTIPGHVYWKNKEGVLLGCNNLQAKSAGFCSKEDLIGKTDYDLPWKEQADTIRKVDLEVIQKGASLTVEEPATLLDGNKAIYLSKKVPLYDVQKNIIGVLGVSLDITEHKKTQQQLLETQHKLEGMTLFSAVIAHELRTPLSAFGVACDGLKAIFPQLKQAYLWAQAHNAPLPDYSPEYLDGIEQSLDSMNNEVRAAFTFIDMALLNSDPNVDKGNREIFSLSACVEEALSRYPFQGKRDLVQWHYDPQTDFEVRADKILLTHVLFNLLKNALYYIAASGKGNIQIWLEKGDDYHKLYFKDTGPGIDSEILPHIFERFFSRTYHGAGIGLTFCKTVMESLKGNISCSSVKNDYTLFVLTFPVNI